MSDYLQRWSAPTLQRELALARAKLAHATAHDVRDVPGRALWVRTLEDETARRSRGATDSSDHFNRLPNQSGDDSTAPPVPGRGTEAT